ncbi:MAG: hypothetical protein U9N84_07485 [Actinomycetota bacterium]|nr:hypothetical protein [Actinomycetota bacterium]
MDTTTDPASDYQHYWWIDETRGSYYAQGDHCQYIYVDLQTDMVLARHGSECGDTDWVGFLGDIADWLQSQFRNE